MFIHSRTVIGIFFDDLLVAGNSVDEITKVREQMNKHFLLTDQGELEYYLGVEVSKIDQNTLLLHQTAYAKKIIERFKMTDSDRMQASQNAFAKRFKSESDEFSR